MFRTTISLACLTSLAGAALGGSVDIIGDAGTSNESTGVSFAGTLDYAHLSGTTGQLSISLTNTTSSAIGGYLTGFVFGIAGLDDGASATLNTASDNDFLNTGIEAANPFGTFDAGAALNANWGGGGNPSRGLGVGATGLFTFTVSASDAASLTTMDFLGEGTDFAVRFRGLNDNGSDKLLVYEPNLNVVPLPSGVLAAAGMLGLCVGVRAVRRR